MGSPFDELMAGVDATVTATFGELVVLTPRVMGNYGVAVDPDRPEKSPTAIVSISPVAGDLLGTNTRGGMSRGRTTGEAKSSVWIGKAEAAALGYDILAGDQIELRTRRHRPCFRVEDVFVTDMGDVEMTVTAEGPRR